MSTLKKKRLKTVFTNSEVCHVWASQTQSEGSNSTRSIWFRDNRIYSYGTHYLLGQILNVKGKKVVMINSRGYSPTTSGHIWEVRSATKHMLQIDSNTAASPKEALIDIAGNLAEEYFDYFTHRLPGWHSGAKRFQSFKKDVEEFNSHCDLFGFKNLKIKLDPLHRDLYVEKYMLAKKREAELNTPEMKAKREAERLKREAKRTEKEIIEREKREAERIARELAREKELKELEATRGEAIEAWQAGAPIRWDLRDLETQLIRIYDNHVETSAGATVPLDEAREFLKRLKRGQVKRGDSIGRYAFEKLKGNICIIGCHRIDLRAAESVLRETSLRLLQGGAK